MIVRSALPVANHSLELSTAQQRTHPVCPLINLIISHGACHSGALLFIIARLLLVLPFGSLIRIKALEEDGNNVFSTFVPFSFVFFFVLLFSVSFVLLEIGVDEMITGAGMSLTCPYSNCCFICFFKFADSISK